MRFGQRHSSSVMIPLEPVLLIMGIKVDDVTMAGQTRPALLVLNKRAKRGVRFFGQCAINQPDKFVSTLEPAPYQVKSLLQTKVGEWIPIFNGVTLESK